MLTENQKFDLSESKEKRIEDIIEDRKIPSQPEKRRVKNYLKNLMKEGVSPEDKKGFSDLAREFLNLYEGKFLDQRRIFKGEKLVNKNFVKETIEEKLKEGNDNLLRLSVDVEGLKTVNDIMGHEKGDEYLSLIYKKIKQSIEDIKEANPELSPKLDFIISGEGGDEFGILIVGPRDGSIDLNEVEFKLSSDKDSAGERLGNTLGQQINDRMGEIDFEKRGVIEAEKIKERIGSCFEEYYDNYLSDIESNLSSQVIDEKLRHYEKAVLEDFGLNSWEELTDEDKKRKLIEIVEVQKKEKLQELEERFSDYKFFASVSCGFSSLKELSQEEEEFIRKKTQEIQEKTKNINPVEAEVLAKMDTLFREADKNMSEEKELFKYQARRTRYLGSQDPQSRDYWLKKEGANLANHIMVLSRSNEQMELLIEMEEVYEENNYLNTRRMELRKEVQELKDSLKECQDKLK